jgi:N-methylhydantoinase A/oxoprolinase/acetone carboxylase beta subunit
MTLSSDRARTAAAPLARTLRLDLDRLAEGIVRVANASMERAIRAVSIERGHDPRRFALLAFGGAGGMHACELAERLDVQSVVVPRHAGVLSALGMLIADVVKDYSAHVLQRSENVTMAGLAARFAPLVRRARADLAREGFDGRRQVITQMIDVRYAGQSYELTVPFSQSYRRNFDLLHEKTYGYANPSRPTEIVNVRVSASGLVDKPRLPFVRPRRPFSPAPSATVPGRFGGRSTRVRCYVWDELGAGATAAGPAVITSETATVVVPPAFRFHVDGFGNVIARRVT